MIFTMKSFYKRYKFIQTVHSNSKNNKKLSSMPLNFGLGQIIDVFQISERIFNKFSKFSYDHENVVILNLLTQPALFVNDPKLIKEIFITKRLPKSKQTYDILKTLLGNGLIVSDGDIWKRERNLIVPLFTHQNVSKLTSIMIDYTKNIIEKWKIEKKSENMEFMTEISKLTLEIISASFVKLFLVFKIFKIVHLVIIPIKKNPQFYGMIS